MEILRNRKIRVGAVCALGGISLAVLAGCGDGPNYSGAGNAFVVDGRVDHSGDHSITASIYDVKVSSGDAVAWFEDKNPKHQIHDNCNCDSDGGNIVFGKVLDASGVQIDLKHANLPAGSCMEMTGEIHDQREGKSYSQVPVFDIAQVIPCPTK